MDFMLGSLFYRFISENLTAHCNRLMREAGVEDADYAAMADEDAGSGSQRNGKCQRFLHTAKPAFHQRG